MPPIYLRRTGGVALVGAGFGPSNNHCCAVFSSNFPAINSLFLASKHSVPSVTCFVSRLL